MSVETKLDYDERYLRSRFDSVASFTVGAEEELLLLDPTTGAPSCVADRALALFGDDPRVVAEFRASQVELVSPVCVAVADVARELSAVRHSLTTGLAPDAVPVATGAHPLAVDPGAVAAAPRYEAIATTESMASCASSPARRESRSTARPPSRGRGSCAPEARPAARPSSFPHGFPSTTRRRKT